MNNLRENITFFSMMGVMFGIGIFVIIEKLTLFLSGM